MDRTGVPYIVLNVRVTDRQMARVAFHISCDRQLQVVSQVTLMNMADLKSCVNFVRVTFIQRAQLMCSNDWLIIFCLYTVSVILIHKS